MVAVGTGRSCAQAAPLVSELQWLVAERDPRLDRIARGGIDMAASFRGAGTIGLLVAGTTQSSSTAPATPRSAELLGAFATSNASKEKGRVSSDRPRPHCADKNTHHTVLGLSMGRSPFRLPGSKPSTR